MSPGDQLFLSSIREFGIGSPFGQEMEKDQVSPSRCKGRCDGG